MRSVGYGGTGCISAGVPVAIVKGGADAVVQQGGAGGCRSAGALVPSGAVCGSTGWCRVLGAVVQGGAGCVSAGWVRCWVVPGAVVQGTTGSR